MSKPLKQTENAIPAQLLVEAFTQVEGGRVLAYNAHQIALETLAARAEQVVATGTSAITQAEQRASVHATTVEFLTDVALPPAAYGTFDTVVIEAPQSRALARRWLVEARAALREGGALYLGGMNDGGIRSLIGDTEALFGNAHTLFSKRRARVARALKQGASPAPAWASEPGIAPGTWHGFEADLGDGKRRIESLPGVFSYDRIDIATRLLLDHIGDVAGKRVLDMGCGYGIIGLVLAQRGAASVDMLDENLYAAAAARRNAAAYGIANINAVAADVRAAPFAGPYDLVATNPPFHRGKHTDHTTTNAFIACAESVLAPRGRLVLVANSFLRYDAVMREHFARVESIAQTPSFTLWQAEKV